MWKEIRTFLDTNKEQDNFDLNENFKQNKDFAPIKKQVKQIKKEEPKKEILLKETKPTPKVLPSKTLPKQETPQTDNFWGFKKVYVGKLARPKKISSKNNFYGKKNFNKKRRK